MSESFYDILNIDRNATTPEIKQAYRKKAAQHHPDVSNDPNAEEKFKNIKRAKDVLTDPSLRKTYDQVGHSQFEQAQKQGGFSNTHFSGDPSDFFTNANFSTSGFGNLFETFFGGTSRSTPRRGKTLTTSLEVDLEDAYSGVTKTIRFTRPESCTKCNGTGHPSDAKTTNCSTCNGTGTVTRTSSTLFGQIQQVTTCPTCNGERVSYSKKCNSCSGSGTSINKTEIPFQVPPGVLDGTTFLYEGEGAALKNGTNGDLKVTISIKPHPEFKREGSHIYYSCEIPFQSAVFGTKVNVPTIGGSSELTIPPGTQSGDIFTLSGSGMPQQGRKKSFGDQIVKVQIPTPHPSSLTSEQKKVLKSFEKSAETSTKAGIFDKLKDL
ncbi:MAG TPA: DnaJ domain-containing protein [Halobacteriales archaeon]|jgi:molecular chaperone DnaJ|nr:DnaJ domain-containing protein [Halobacteriales archaeon]